ncbi:MAG: ComEC/Rec2-like protein, competence protein ComEC [candidate division Kazan bacterium GW2011_GWA1_50_15]|uniref:ComEC/Rec2-related protein n=2 Tax=Bacteria division Kazan-3B-28 TaxID=1798534 RepID=A0A0G2A4L2_UNCK3|nr:MAG: ComEC/Rec2-like protein, competence protein ComEC [candidate division Kazan bacterium GW2011_GWA1_50_15]KKW25811.1 MAG: ComEC/Rec2-related protein [candidate division Kazan bacterium GW2011_GWC1_52_13]KKW27174.1 MAG: ComEC/Rec2-related protein [candidate division Kazan bacterium GW2011_GWB1_52_7]HCR42464.1 hypothetical protein [Patescibacteria group bacterium]
MVRPHQFVAAFAGSFLLGVLVASRFGLDWPAIIIGLALFLILLLLPTQPPIKFLAVAMLGLLLGWWRYGAAVTLPSDLITRWVGQTSGLVGTVANDPVMSGTRQKFYLRVQTVDGQPASGKILLTAWQLPRWEFGDKLQAEVKLALPEVNEEFDYPAYLAKGGVYALGQTASEVQLVDKPRWSWQRELFRLKHWLAHQTQVLVPDPQGMLMNGLLLGMRSSLSDELQTQLKNSGTTHIVALSGMNITIVAGFFFWLMRRLRRRWALVLAGIGILLFVVMTGASASIVRAAIMGWVMLLSALWGRRRDLTNAILLAAVLMVALNPLILQYDTGFQLSLAATAGIVYLSPSLLLGFRRWPNVLASAAATTIGATVATLPLVIFHFGGFSVVTLFANLVVVPLVPLVMLVGFITMLVGIVAPTWQWLGWPSVWAAGSLLAIIKFFGDLPWAFVPITALSAGWPVLYYLGLIGIYFFPRARATQKI